MSKILLYVQVEHSRLNDAFSCWQNYFGNDTITEDYNKKCFTIYHWCLHVHLSRKLTQARRRRSKAYLYLQHSSTKCCIMGGVILRHHPPRRLCVSSSRKKRHLLGMLTASSTAFVCSVSQMIFSFCKSGSALQIFQFRENQGKLRLFWEFTVRIAVQ